MSFAPINAISWLAGTPCCRASRGKRCETFVTAGPRCWAVISMSATGADIASKYLTRVAIAVAPSARPRPAPSGSLNGRRSCCPFLTSTSRSRFHGRSVAWRFRIQDRSIPSCFRLLRKPSSPSPPTPSTLVLPSASSPCCTPGVRICIFIRTCIASCPAAASPQMGPVGSLAASAPSSFLIKSSAACSANFSFSPWEEPFAKVSFAYPANCAIWPSRPRSSPCVKQPPYPKRSGPIIPSPHAILPPEHFRILFIIGNDTYGFCGGPLAVDPAIAAAPQV